MGREGVDALETVMVQGSLHNKERIKRLVACVEKEGRAAYGVPKGWLEAAKAALRQSERVDVMLDIGDEAVPKEVLRNFATSLGKIIYNKKLDGRAVRELEYCVEYETAQIRKKGFAFPTLRVLYFESLGWIEIVRADLEHEGIQRIVQNVIQRFPGVSVQQLVTSIQRAFPLYHPDDTGAEGLHAIAAVEKQRVNGFKLS